MAADAATARTHARLMRAHLPRSSVFVVCSHHEATCDSAEARADAQNHIHRVERHVLEQHLPRLL